MAAQKASAAHSARTASLSRHGLKDVPFKKRIPIEAVKFVTRILRIS
jgi:hypothetical protein